MWKNQLSQSNSTGNFIVTPVYSHNEWDPLKEIIVGCAEGACFPLFTTEVKACLIQCDEICIQRTLEDHSQLSMLEKLHVDEVEEMCIILQQEGVIVC